MQRRDFVKMMATSSLIGAYGVSALGNTPPQKHTYNLTAGSMRHPLGTQGNDYDILTYNNQFRSPVLQAKMGERFTAVVTNKMDMPTTVHWHGVRVPHAMDGVPNITQPPIETGETFTYDYIMPDAGTYWYHPHILSSEQVGRGLSGVLVVNEPNPPPVDRDIVWQINDWLIDGKGNFQPFNGKSGGMMDSRMMDGMAGRLGNWVTVNGLGMNENTLTIQQNERIRLRLVNTSNARIMQLVFENMPATIIAIDGHAVSPRPFPKTGIILGSGQRVDMMIDGAESGQTFDVRDVYEGGGRAYSLGKMITAGRMRDKPLTDSIQLPPPTFARPDLQNAEHIDIDLDGGMMAQKSDRSSWMDGMDVQKMKKDYFDGKIWYMNGRSMTDAMMLMPMPANPLFHFKMGKTYMMTMRNNTRWSHPMHIHGLLMQVISINGKPVGEPWFTDTVMVHPKQKVQVAILADNLGEWMFHCHVLGHQRAGMMGLLNVI